MRSPTPRPRGPRSSRGSAQLPVSAARMHDYLLGGAHNFAADRAAATELLRAYPAARTDAWANCAFARRAVAYLCGVGVRQFLDLGSGIPTSGASLHELAQRLVPGARVAYVDTDPVAVEHGRRVLADAAGTAVLHEDLCEPELVLGSSEVADLLGPGQLIDAYGNALAPGSCLVFSHATTDGLTPDQVAVAERVYEDAGTPLTLRTPQQAADLVDGYPLISAAADPPGHTGREAGDDNDAAHHTLRKPVPVHQWRPDPLEAEHTTRSVYGALALLRDAGSAATRTAMRSAAPALPSAPAFSGAAFSGPPAGRRS